MQLGYTQLMIVPRRWLQSFDYVQRKKPPLNGRFSCFLFIFFGQHVVRYVMGLCKSFFKILFRSCTFRAGLLPADSGEFIPLSFINDIFLYKQFHFLLFRFIKASNILNISINKTFKITFFNHSICHFKNIIYCLPTTIIFSVIQTKTIQFN